MTNYIGVKCPVCNKKFTQSDDIVVCPVCGAPHHRACYAKENACAFTADHLSGKEWRAPAPDTAPTGESAPDYQDQGGENTGDFVVCNTCRAKNPKDTIFCQTCGARISSGAEGFWGNFSMGIDPTAIVYGGLNPDEKIEDETARDLALYIGSGSAYYLPKFKRIAEYPYTPTFNLAALIFNFFYFFYRKMNLAGGILLGFFVISSIPTFLYMQEFPVQFMQEFLPTTMHQYLGKIPDVPADPDKIAYYHQLINASGTINFILSILVALAANRLYYIKAMADVKHIRESQPQTHDEIAYCGELQAAGGVSKIAIIIVAVVYCVSYFTMSSLVVTKYFEILQMGGTLPL